MSSPKDERDDIDRHGLSYGDGPHHFHRREEAFGPDGPWDTVVFAQHHLLVEALRPFAQACLSSSLITGDHLKRAAEVVLQFDTGKLGYAPSTPAILHEETLHELEAARAELRIAQDRADRLEDLSARSRAMAERLLAERHKWQEARPASDATIDQNRRLIDKLRDAEDTIAQLTKAADVDLLCTLLAENQRMWGLAARWREFGEMMWAMMTHGWDGRMIPPARPSDDG